MLMQVPERTHSGSTLPVWLPGRNEETRDLTGESGYIESSRSGLSEVLFLKSVGAMESSQQEKE